MDWLMSYSLLLTSPLYHLLPLCLRQHPHRTRRWRLRLRVGTWNSTQTKTTSLEDHFYGWTVGCTRSCLPQVSVPGCLHSRRARPGDQVNWSACSSLVQQSTRSVAKAKPKFGLSTHPFGGQRWIQFCKWQSSVDLFRCLHWHLRPVHGGQWMGSHGQWKHVKWIKHHRHFAQLSYSILSFRVPVKCVQCVLWRRRK